ncbi:hypothetical protein GGX14DRAFT_624765, partial [Mycena pura]
IGIFGGEVRQPSNPFANLSEVALRYAQVNALYAMDPDLDRKTTNKEKLPRYSLDLGNGYVLLRRRDRYPITLKDKYDVRAICMHLGIPAESKLRFKRWGRLRLPNGQIARSVFGEANLSLRNIRKLRCVKIKDANRPRIVEVSYYFVANDIAYALGRCFPDADVDLLRESYGTLWAAPGPARGRIVFSVSLIQSVVAMIPYILDGKDIFFLVEKPGLEMASMGGFEEEDNEAEDPEEEHWHAHVTGDQTRLVLCSHRQTALGAPLLTARPFNCRKKTFSLPHKAILPPRDLKTSGFRHMTRVHENLIANATHEQLWMNSVYFQLWHSNTVLKAKYDTLQTNYSTLATSMPQIFSIIPNPYSVTVPASTFSTTAQFLVPSTKPEKIKYWRRSDYNIRKATRGDLSVSNDESGTDSDEKMPKKKKKKAKTENVLGFLENEDGTPFNDDRISFVRSTAYKSFNSLLNAGLAPANWRDCSLEITNRFRREMIEVIPALALGENYWKVDAVGTEVYAQWKRKHLPAATLEKGKGKEVTLEKRKRAHDGRFGHKRRHLEESANRAPLDTAVISLDDTRSPSPPPVEMPPPPPVEMPQKMNTRSPSPAPIDTPQEMNEPVLPTPPPDTPMPHFTEPTTEPEREEMVQVNDPLSHFYVEAPQKSVLHSTRIRAVASTIDSGSKSTPLTTANTVASTSKDASSKPKGATYFIPTATLTGYNLFGKSFTDDGKKKIPREQVKAEYQRPENKQRWDKIAKERKAEEKNKTEAAAASVESQPA